jgi:hypothetical protein
MEVQQQKQLFIRIVEHFLRRIAVAVKAYDSADCLLAELHLDGGQPLAPSWAARDLGLLALGSTIENG